MTQSPYTFTIENGSDELSLEFCGNSCYLRFDKPVCVSFDNQMDGFHYFDLTPHYLSFREEVNKLIGDRLNSDFSGSEAEFLASFESLLSKFGNGKYILHLNAEKVFSYTVSTAENTQASNLIGLVFGELIKEKRTFFDLSDMYDPFDEGDWYVYEHVNAILATKTSDELSEQSIRFFEDKIRKNERPVIILFRAFFDDRYQYSDYFMLDGHHKFKAYQNLKTIPRVITITRVYNATDTRFLPDPLIECLNDDLNTAVFNSVFYDDKATNWLIQHPESKVHNYIRNGLLKTYFDNGQLQQETNYKFNRIVGVSRKWYRSGQLEYENQFDNGIRTGSQKRFYKSGKLWEEIIIEDPKNSRPIKYEWYENGILKKESVYQLGLERDVIPIKTWYENGQPETEVTGVDIKNYESKTWDKKGDLIEHFTVINSEKKWLIPAQNAPDETYYINKRLHQQARLKQLENERRIRAQTPVKKEQYGYFDKQVLWGILIFLAILLKLIILAFVR